MYAKIVSAYCPFGLFYWSRGIKRSLVAIVAGVGACGILAYAIKKIHRNLHLLQQRQNELPIGLPNPRNLCYLNALLQAMAANSSLVRFLQRSAMIRRQKILLCLVCLLKGLRCPSRYLVAHGLDETLSFIHGELLHELTTVHHWATGEQQDAPELFTFFMDIACFRELGYTATKAAGGLTSVSQFTGQRFETVAPNCYHRYRLANGIKPSSLILQSPLRTEVFQQHLIATQVTCSQCDYRGSPIIQPEACLTVFFDPKRQSRTKPECTESSCASHFTLGACLRKQFCVSERLPDMYCPKCQSKANPSSSGSAFGYCQRKQWLARLPSCLIIHVQRGQWRHYSMNSGDIASDSNHFGTGVKCADCLVFPYKLDMNRYTSSSLSKESISGDCLTTDGEREAWNSAPPKLYLLRGILVHQGHSINSGHYVTYRAWTRPYPSSTNRRENSLVHFLKTIVLSTSNFFQGLSYTVSRAVSSPWILASDSWVTRVPAEEVRDCSAYLLFYERTTSYNLITGSTASRQGHRCHLPNTDCPAEYADWEQADGSASGSPCLHATARNMDEIDEDPDLDDAEEYDDTDGSDEMSDSTNDFLLTTGSRADVIKSLALAISQM